MVLQAPLARAGVRPQASKWGRVWGAAPGFSWAPLERRLCPEPTSCQPVDVLGGVAAVLPFVAAARGVVDAAFWFVVVVAAGAAWGAVAVPVRAEAAGAGSPRDSISSRRRVLIAPSRDGICRWSEAIIACSAVGGAGGGWAGRLPPLRPL